MNEITLWIMTGGMVVLSVLSGMLGLGVAFAAVPFLSFFLPDLVDQVQPLTLLLNGFTGFASAWGFSRSGFVDWKRALPLAGVTTVAAPIGAAFVHSVPQTIIWGLYLASVSYLVYRLFRPVKGGTNGEETEVRHGMALLLAVPISMLSGLLGVGPGFLLMPTLIILGYEPKKAAGVNAVAITPPSFTSLVPHLSEAQWDVRALFVLVPLSVFASFLGARLTSRFVRGPRLKQLFGLVIVIMTAYKVFRLLC